MDLLSGSRAAVVKAGDRVTVTAAYEMATKAQTRRDEWTDRIGTVRRVIAQDALVCFGRTESDLVWIHFSRLVKESANAGNE